MFQIYLAIIAIVSLCIFNPKFAFIKDKLKMIGIKIIYNMIYYFSVCQIKCNQIYNYFLPYFKSVETHNPNNPINPIKIEQFDFDTNKLTTLLEKELGLVNRLQNDLFIVSDTSRNSLINKKIVATIINAHDCTFDQSEIAFIALYLNYNDERYNINLKTDEFNYYLVGNVIDKRFIQYYINVVLKIKFDYENEKNRETYQLELMDHEVNMINLDANQSIIIEKNGYRVVNDGDEEDEEEEEKEKDADYEEDEEEKEDEYEDEDEEKIEKVEEKDPVEEKEE